MCVCVCFSEYLVRAFGTKMNGGSECGGDLLLLVLIRIVIYVVVGV